MLLLLIIGSCVSCEDPFTIDELDGSHQSWKFPSVLREVCQEKKASSYKSFMKKGQKRRGLNTLLPPAPCS